MKRKPLFIAMFIICFVFILNFAGFFLQSSANGITSPPIFSHPGGFYDNSFELELSVKGDAEIYYTLDGSMPTKDSIRYTKPIKIKKEVVSPGFSTQIITKGVRPELPISYIKTNPKEAADRMQWKPPEKEIFKGTVVRAVAYNQLGIPSKVITNTYFVDKNMKERYTFPVVSIVCDIDDLFDYEKGIYIPGKVYEDNGYGDSYWGTPNANYHQRGREWGRPAHLEFFEPDGQFGFSLNGGIRIHGMGSRVLPQKSLRFYARSEYDEVNKIEYDIFKGLKKPHSNEPVTSFKRILFRNGGQDGYKSIFKDLMLQSLIEHTDLDIQGYRPSIVFINGEYWGIHNIRQKYDLRYFESNYGVDETQVVILDTAAGRLGDGLPGDEQHFKNMVKYIRNNDITQKEHYDYINTLMDVENFITYCVFNVYIGNFDWPSNNVSIWRYKTNYNPDAPYGLDGRWRWMVFDTDYGFGFKDASYNSLFDLIHTEEEGSDKKDWSTELFRLLIKNEEFKNTFINGFADHMNTTFNVERVIDRIDYLEKLYEPEMQEHIDRWHYPRETVSDWKKVVNNLRTYAKERPKYILQHLEEAFNVDTSDMAQLTLNANPEQGSFKVNLATIDENTPAVPDGVFPWTGRYFKGIPIRITAVNKPGYVFAGWKETGEKSDTITVSLDDNLTLTALFVADPYHIMDAINDLPDIDNVTLKDKPRIEEIRNKITDALNAGLQEKDILNLEKLTRLENKVDKLAEKQASFLIYILLATIIIGGAVLGLLSRIQKKSRNTIQL